MVLACEDGCLIDPSADLREWSAILAQAGISHTGTHTMRHSAATIALDEGIALAVFQEMWFVSGDVRPGGCAAFAAWLRTGHGLAAALGLALELPAVAWLGERVYGWVAAGVIAFPGHGGILSGYEPEHRSGDRGAGRADGVPAFCSR